MYVIYPADDIIYGILAREYSPVDSQQSRRHQQRQQIIVPNLIPEDHPPNFQFSSTSSTSTSTNVSQSVTRRESITTTFDFDQKRKSFPSSFLSFPKKASEIEKVRGDPVRPPRASSSSSSTSKPKSNKSSAPDRTVITTSQEENHISSSQENTKRQKPKRSVSFTAAFRSKSKDTGGVGDFLATKTALGSSSLSLAKVAPTPDPIIARPGFTSSSGISGGQLLGGGSRGGSVSRELPGQSQNALLNRRKTTNHGDLVPGPNRLTVAAHLDREDHSFANFRGQNYHGGVTPATGALQTTPPILPSTSGKKPPLPLPKLTLSSSSSASKPNPVNTAAATAPISLPTPNSSRAGSVPRSLLLSSNSSPTARRREVVRSSPQPQPQTAGVVGSRNSPFGRESRSGSSTRNLPPQTPIIATSSHLSRMAGHGLNGGSSVSGSLLALGGSGGSGGISGVIGIGGLTHGHGHGHGPPPFSQGGAAALLAAGTALIDANSIKDCAHPSLNENLKAHNAMSFQVIRIVSDFTQQLSQLHEQHSVQLQMLVESFRKRNADLRKEKPTGSNALFSTWETLLSEVEIDSQAHSDICGSLGRQIARPLLEKTFCLKIQSRKVFAHRESFETVLAKAESQLANAYGDYNDACLVHIQQGNNATLAKYYDSHNAYVQQLRGTNSMLREYHNETLPAMLQELEEVYVDLVNTLSESILLASDIVSNRSQDTSRRYDTLAAVCRNVNGGQDLKEFVKGMVVPAAPPAAKHSFQVPLPILQAAESSGELPQDLSHVPILKEEVIMERQAAMSARNRLEGLKKEMMTMESEMKQLQDSMDTLIRMQERSLDSNLWNKANELQEEISMKRFDLRVAQMHYAALRSQKELYAPGSTLASSSKADPSHPSTSTSASSKLGSSSGGNRGNLMGGDMGGGGGPGDDQGGGNGKGLSSSGSDRGGKVPPGGMKSKWLKAFKSLKSTTEKEPEKKNGKDKDLKEPYQIFENHIFQEYTYKKITPCDICSQILRGHTRQGMRCRMCKTNVHADCQEKVGKCQPKTRLLRRQKSTSELETRLSQLAEQQPFQQDDQDDAQGGENEFDATYQVLKDASVMKRPGGGGSSCGSGSGNGIHGSNQTLHSQHEMTPSRVGRSNPSVNVISGGSSAHSGPSTPVHPSVAAASASGFSSALNQRRDSYLSRKSISADADAGPSSHSLRGLISLPPRSISLTASPQMPHSPRRRKLDLRMKSFSLDSPESSEHAQRRRYAHGSHSTSHSQSWNKGTGPAAPSTSSYYYTNGVAAAVVMGGSGGNLYRTMLNGMVHSNSASNNQQPPSLSSSSSEFYSSSQTPFASLNHFAPSSPVQNRRTLLSTRNVRMSSVELPDENDKSLSSASTSPCPSPQKPHRLLPTNFYVCLFMFKARHPDELDLKAGNRVTVVDTSDPDWWQGKCMGRIGYFPSKYVTKLHPGERPLQVTHNLQVTDGADNGLKLLRDQIVIQIGEELDGMVTIRNGDNKQGICPVKYLQEV